MKEFIDRLKNKLGSEIVLIQLFGSYARGEAHKDSDIDILVVLKAPTDEQINYICDAAMKTGNPRDIYLSVKIFSKSEFEYYKNIPTLFIKNVLTDGIKLS